MTTIGVVLFCLAQAGPPHYARQVEAALEADEGLLRHHRGYLAYLQEYPATAAAEAPVNGLRRLSRFRQAVAPFEEVLIQEPELGRRYAGYLRALRDDPAVREAMASLEAARSQFPFVDATLDYFQANPEAAIDFFRAPTLDAGLPEALLPHVTRFQRNRDLRATLLDAFSQLAPATGSAVREWWRTAYGEEGSRDAWLGLDAYFRDNPGHASRWIERQLGLAADPRAASWIHHWHGLIRRDAILSESYYDYLGLLEDQPQLAAQTAAYWEQRYKEAPPWPPEGLPPPLATSQPPDSIAPRIRRPTRPTVRYPARPGVPYPRLPASPSEPRPPAQPRVPAPFEPRP
jgi:hypothetical protein